MRLTLRLWTAVKKGLPKGIRIGRLEFLRHTLQEWVLYVLSRREGPAYLAVENYQAQTEPPNKQQLRSIHLRP